MIHAHAHNCYLIPASIAIRNTRFTGNFCNAPQAIGGALLVSQLDSSPLETITELVLVENCYFKDNTAPIGGAFRMAIRIVTLAMTGTIFRGNSAQGGSPAEIIPAIGGAISLDQFLVGAQITESRFFGNTCRGTTTASASPSGCAIITSDVPSLIINDSIFNKNRCIKTGGPPPDSSSFLTATSGGALESLRFVSISMLRNTFIRNSAEAGGAILLSAPTGQANFTDVSFIRNRATPLFGGGAIYIDSIVSFERNDVVFRSNFPDDVGGPGDT